MFSGLENGEGVIQPLSFHYGGFALEAVVPSGFMATTVGGVHQHTTTRACPVAKEEGESRVLRVGLSPKHVMRRELSGRSRLVSTILSQGMTLCRDEENREESHRAG